MAMYRTTAAELICEALEIIERHHSINETYEYLQKNSSVYLRPDIINANYDCVPSHCRQYDQHQLRLHGFTLLSQACHMSNHKAVKLLLENGADVKGSGIITYECTLPIIFACVNCNYECIKLLIQYGADINDHTTDENTPLNVVMSRSICSNNIKCAKLLIEASANVNAIVNGWPLFVYTCWNNPVEYVTLLIEADCICDLDAVKRCDNIGSVLYAIDCHEAKKERRAQQLAMIKRAAEY